MPGFGDIVSGMLRTGWDWFLKNPEAAGVIVTVVTILGAGAGGWVRWWRRHSRVSDPAPTAMVSGREVHSGQNAQHSGTGHIHQATASGSGRAVTVVGAATVDQSVHGEPRRDDNRELARELSRQVIEFEDAFRSARSRLVRVSTPLGASVDEQKQAMAEHLWGRYERVAAPVRKLESAFVEARVLWGDHVVELMVPLRKCFLELRAKLEERLHLPSGQRDVSGFFCNPSEESTDRLHAALQAAVKGIRNLAAERGNLPGG